MKEETQAFSLPLTSFPGGVLNWQNLAKEPEERGLPTLGSSFAKESWDRILTTASAHKGKTEIDVRSFTQKNYKNQSFIKIECVQEQESI